MDQYRLNQLRKKIQAHFENMSEDELQVNIQRTLIAYNEFFSYHESKSNSLTLINCSPSNINAYSSIWNFRNYHKVSSIDDIAFNRPYIVPITKEEEDRDLDFLKLSEVLI